MRQSEKVRAVYAELRRAVGPRAPAAEVLACAASLVELFAVDEGMPAYEIREGREPFDCLPVDRVLADGGWRMLAREWGLMGWESSDGCGGLRRDAWAFA